MSMSARFCWKSNTSRCEPCILGPDTSEEFVNHSCKRWALTAPSHGVSTCRQKTIYVIVGWHRARAQHANKMSENCSSKSATQLSVMTITHYTSAHILKNIAHNSCYRPVLYISCCLRTNCNTLSGERSLNGAQHELCHVHERPIAPQSTEVTASRQSSVPIHGPHGQYGHIY